MKQCPRPVRCGCDEERFGGWPFSQQVFAFVHTIYEERWSHCANLLGICTLDGTSLSFLDKQAVKVENYHRGYTTEYGCGHTLVVQACDFNTCSSSLLRGPR